MAHVEAAPAAVIEALSATPRFTQPLPLALRAGFPRPVAATGGGLGTGDERRITFVGDDHHGTTHTGDLHLRVTERSAEHATFAVVADHTRVAHWLRWQRAEVRWEPSGSGTTVTWKLTYERQLAPGWYFAPLQHAAARVAAGYLIDAAATPAHA
jgi:hypothetical protein